MAEPTLGDLILLDEPEMAGRPMKNPEVAAILGGRDVAPMVLWRRVTRTKEST